MTEPIQELLSRDELLKEAPRRYKIVGPLPVRGGFCRVQSLTELEASRFEAAHMDQTPAVRRARLEDANRRFVAA